MLVPQWLLPLPVALLGLVVGSFLNVVIGRVPAGESVVWPGSRCPKCHAPLRWFDNVPLLSWLLLRGRCRYCKEPISWRYPAVELLTALLFLACVSRFGTSWALVRGLLMVGLLVPLAFIDLEHWVLPFQLTLPGAVVGLLTAVPLGRTVLLESAIGAAGGFLFFFGLEVLLRIVLRREALGAGDKWLMLLVGAYLGYRPLFGVLLLSTSRVRWSGGALLLARGRAGPAAPPPRRAGDRRRLGTRGDPRAVRPVDRPGGAGDAAPRTLAGGDLPRPLHLAPHRPALGAAVKLRVVAIAFLLAIVSTGLTWLSFQPVMLRLVEALRAAAPLGSAPRQVLQSAQQILPVYLGLDLLILLLVCFGILYLTVARPLTAVENEMAKLERPDLGSEQRGGGPLLSRFQASLRRTAAALASRACGDPPPARRPRRGQRPAHPDPVRAGGQRAAGDRGPAGRGRGPRDRQSPLRAPRLVERRALPERVRSGAGWLPPGDGDRGPAHRRASSAGLLDLGRPVRTQVGPVPVAELVRVATRLVGSGPEFRDVDGHGRRSGGGGGARRPRALEPGADQPPDQRRSGHRGGGSGRGDWPAGRRPGDHRHRGFGPRRPAGASRAGLRAVLHHQVGREGHRTRTRSESASDAGHVGRHRRG